MYLKNERAERIVGLRPIGGLAIDMPWELGYVCPICKKNGEMLTWSEYNSFLWCETCNQDIPSVLCQPDINKAIDIYLDILEDA